MNEIVCPVALKPKLSCVFFDMICFELRYMRVLYTASLLSDFEHFEVLHLVARGG
jgi:hypothetical protein